MILETSIRTLEELYDDFIKNYEMGNFTEGVCHWNGDDALMTPLTFGNRFAEHCSKLGYDAYDYQDHMKELIEWCREHLDHLESKFR